MANTNVRFGNSLKQISRTIAGIEDKRVKDIKEELREELIRRKLITERGDSNPIDYWERGYVPKNPSVVEFFARIGVRRAKLEPWWLKKFLSSAGYNSIAVQQMESELYKAGVKFDRPVPLDIPSQPRELLGRQTELAVLSEAMKSSFPLWLIMGIGGVGKTTLAREVANACAQQPSSAAENENWPEFDVIIWLSADIRGLTLDEVLNAVARHLGYPATAQKPVDEKLKELREKLAEHSALIIIDNFETVVDPDVALFVSDLPRGVRNGIKVLLTSREEGILRHPIFARRRPSCIPLEGLSDVDAVTFLRDEAQRQAKLNQKEKRSRLLEVFSADEEMLLTLVRAVEGNPKALELALGCIAKDLTPLPVLVQQIYAASESLQDLFDYFFEKAWEQCGEREGAQQLWQIMSFSAVPAPRRALEAASGLNGRYFTDALKELRERFLIDVSGLDEGLDNDQRYHAHPLVHAFGALQMRENPDFEAAARDRWVKWYEGFVDLYGGDDWNNWKGFQILSGERENIIKVAAWCHRNKRLDPVWKLAKGCAEMLNVTSYWKERENLFEWALELAREQGNAYVIAESLRELAWSMFLSDRRSGGNDLLAEALPLAYKLDDKELICHIITGQAYVKELMHKYGAAERLNNDAQDLLSEIDDERKQIRNLVQISYQQGRLAFVQRDFRRARQYFEKVLVLGEESRWDRAIAYGANWLGDIDLEIGNFDGASSQFHRAWDVIRPWNDRRRVASLNFSEAKLAWEYGNRGRSRELAELALQQFMSLEMGEEALVAKRWIKAHLEE